MALTGQEKNLNETIKAFIAKPNTYSHCRDVCLMLKYLGNCLKYSLDQCIMQRTEQNKTNNLIRNSYLTVTLYILPGAFISVLLTIKLSLL